MSSLSYQNCYEILSLANDATWDEASVRYRKLVQQWHPDRYTGKDQQKAEARFIEINKAYNRLRDYYQKHDALPFASVETDVEAEPLMNRASGGGSRKRNSRVRVSENPVKRISPFMWLIIGVFIIGVGLFLAMMIQLEKKSSAKNREAARLQRVLELEQQNSGQINPPAGLQ